MMSTARSWFGRTHKNRFIGMSFDMLLQVLWTFEGFATEVAFVWFQRDVDSDVRSDMVAFDGGSVTVAPLAGQVEIIGTLPSNMTLTNVFLRITVSAKTRLGRQARLTYNCSAVGARSEHPAHWHCKESIEPLLELGAAMFGGAACSCWPVALLAACDGICSLDILGLAIHRTQEMPRPIGTAMY